MTAIPRRASSHPRSPPASPRPAWKASFEWLSVPVNLCLAVLGLVFVVSFASWAFGEPFEEAVLWFPDRRKGPFGARSGSSPCLGPGSSRPSS